MTPDELAQVITPELLRESCQQFQRQLLMMPFQVLQDQTAKYITVLPGVRNQLTFGELDGDAQLAPYSTSNWDQADYKIKGRTLIVYPGNCAKDFNALPLLHSIYGESLAQGANISKHDIARKLVSLFAAKIGMHINDVVFVGGVRNVEGKTTADLFDSFDTIIANEILVGNVSSAKGNFVKIGKIDSTNAVSALKEIWRACDKMLKGSKLKVYMYISPEVYEAYCDDYQARHGALPYNQSYDKVFLEGSRGRCEFAVLDNMAGSNYIKVSVKQNFLLGTDIFNQQNHANIGVYRPWVATFEYVGIYGEQIRTLSKEFLLVADISDTEPDPEPEPEPTPTKSDVTVSFEDAVKTAKVGVEFAGQVATTDPAGKTLAYTSSDTEVATVDQSTGAVTLVAAGTTLITAAFAGDDEYNPAQASYALTVEPAGE